MDNSTDSLFLVHGPPETGQHDDLWKILRTSMHPPSPNLRAFAEGCVLFAIIHRQPVRFPDEHADIPLVEDDDAEIKNTRYPSPPAEIPSNADAIGLIYLTSQPQESIVSMGLAIVETARGKPRPNANGKSKEGTKTYAHQAAELVLRYVFEELAFHRVQADIVDCANNGRAAGLFSKMGFYNEGTRRRAAHVDGVWLDMTCVSLLDTDWRIRKTYKASLEVDAPPQSTESKAMWEAMLSRHARERESLLQYEDAAQSRLKRSASTETVRHSDPLKKTTSEKKVPEVDEPKSGAAYTSRMQRPVPSSLVIGGGASPIENASSKWSPDDDESPCNLSRRSSTSSGVYVETPNIMGSSVLPPISAYPTRTEVEYIYDESYEDDEDDDDEGELYESDEDGDASKLQPSAKPPADRSHWSPETDAAPSPMPLFLDTRMGFGSDEEPGSKFDSPSPARPTFENMGLPSPSSPTPPSATEIKGVSFGRMGRKTEESEDAPKSAGGGRAASPSASSDRSSSSSAQWEMI